MLVKGATGIPFFNNLNGSKYNIYITRTPIVMAGSTGMVAVQSFWLWKVLSNKIDDEDPDLGHI